MEVMTGALPSLIPKLANLVAGEYNLQKGVKGDIMFLQEELESMRDALEEISKVPADQLPNRDKIWARNVRELSYDIEDSIDAFMVQSKGRKLVKQYGLQKVIGMCLDWLLQPKIRHKMATEIRTIKRRIVEVHERHLRYEINLGPDKLGNAAVDPRIFGQYTELKELVGIDETRDELIDIMMEGNVVPMKQVSQTPDLKKLFKSLLYDLGKYINEESLDERQLINVLREFLQERRYLIVIDDIWDISVWKMIRCALPDNDIGYIIVTTTRISDVAEKVGGAYKLKPLSLNNSRELMYKIIFGNENRENTKDKEICLDEELAEVSNKILKKCAGVPLAIITMASVLACKARNEMEWYEVYNSIGVGIENNLDVGNMRKILSFSYYDMASHLKTCLLYLSMFPEDYKIEKDRLIWMWIAEGFVQYVKQGKSLFEHGESYFNELINRGMIQPIYNQAGMIYECRVHDMVLGLICSLSNGENFVTILNGLGHGSPSNMIRRLSVQNGNESQAMTLQTRSLQQVRSVVAFPDATASVVTVLRSFRVLRVLDLQDCDLSQCCSLKYLGNLFHLRYLGLCNTSITQLPEEIVNLQLLQILDVWNNKMYCLPSTIVQLRYLMCLYIDGFTRVPNGIGSLTSLEELTFLGIYDSTVDIIEELGQLTELRVLHIVLFGEWNDKLVECLHKLKKVKYLYIKDRSGQLNIGGLDAWVAPPNLQILNTRSGCWFTTLSASAWMNPSLLQDLSFLSTTVRELQQDDIIILGSLPALRYLNLMIVGEDLGVHNEIHGECIVGAGLFPSLVYCQLWGNVAPIVFQRGAMPRLRTLDFRLSVQEVRGINGRDGGIDLGLRNLPSLQKVWVHLDPEGANKAEVKELEAELRRAIKIHPNHPQLYGIQDEDADDE